MQVKDAKTGRFLSQPKFDTKCFFCFKPLSIYPSAKRNKNFCNKVCRGKYMTTQPIQEHAHWQGGRSKIHGYILIKIPQHPFANKQGYVREHRLVMEKHIGRYLNPKEVVHHLNKIKDDNRIENLELIENNRMHIFVKHKKVNSLLNGRFL